jgi:hypothetical protein
MLAVTLSQLDKQIPNDCCVDEKYDDPSDRDPLRDFVKLQRYQRTGDDDGEVLGPSLLQPETDAFGEQQRGVKERTEADLFKFAIVHQPELCDQSVNKAVVGIDSDRGYPIGRKLGDVFVQQLDCAYADGEKQQALGKLKYRDYPEALAVGLVMGTIRRRSLLCHIDFRPIPSAFKGIREANTLAKVGSKDEAAQAQICISRRGSVAGRLKT